MIWICCSLLALWNTAAECLINTIIDYHYFQGTPEDISSIVPLLIPCSAHTVTIILDTTIDLFTYVLASLLTVNFVSFLVGAYKAS